MSFIGAVVIAAFSFVVKRVLMRIDAIEHDMSALDDATLARVQNLDQAAQARILGLEHIYDAKISECRNSHVSREDAIVRFVMEHASEADKKYATVREILDVQDRLLAIDSNVRAILAALDRIVVN